MGKRAQKTLSHRLQRPLARFVICEWNRWKLYDYRTMTSECLGVGMWLWPGAPRGDTRPQAKGAKSPGAKEQNAEEAHRARGPGTQIRLGKVTQNLRRLSLEPKVRLYKSGKRAVSALWIVARAVESSGTTKRCTVVPICIV